MVAATTYATGFAMSIIVCRPVNLAVICGSRFVLSAPPLELHIRKRQGDLAVLMKASCDGGRAACSARVLWAL